MTAIDDWIADIQGNRVSAGDQPIKGVVATCVAAWQLVATVTPIGGSQSPNTVLAGPAVPASAAAPPTFRSLVAADIPDLSATYLPLAGGTMAGAIALPNASAAAPALAFNTNYGLFYDTTNTALGFTVGGNERAWITNTALNVQRTGGQANIVLSSEANTTISATRYSNDVSGPQPGNANKARGTIAAPLVIQTNDAFSQSLISGWDGVSAFQIGAVQRYTCIDTTPGPTAMGARWTMLLSAIGAVGAGTETLRAETATGLSMFGANTVIDANRVFRNRVFTVATLPTAVEGGNASISDATLTMITGLGLAPIGGGANHVPVVADNVGWKII